MAIEKDDIAEFKGIWIPREVWEMKDLNLTEKTFLSIIISFSANGQECIASNSWFAKFFGITKKRASVILNNLSRKKRIGIHIKRDRVSSEILSRVCIPIGIGIPEKKEVIKKGIKKNYTKVDIEEIQKAFYETLTPFIEEYGNEMVQKFYDYWSEPNKSNTKIRWQLERTWDTKKRLRRWKDNELKFSNQKKPHDTGQIMKPKDEAEKQKIVENAGF